MADDKLQYAREYLGALKLFNRGEYFESHEELEQLWVRLPKSPDKTFYQAVIHIAAAFVHRTRGRPKPALAQYRRACDKLQSLGQNEYEGLDIPKTLEYLDPYFPPIEGESSIDDTLPRPSLTIRDWIDDISD